MLACHLRVWPVAPEFCCRSANAASTNKDQPVLVELFTSEGCSDCPPADALLEQLDAKQFVAGARAIVLSEHVTYWDRLGWRDPFSLDAVTERQQEYAERFKLDSPYTPQMVVDGAVQFVGSDQAKLSEAVARASTTPKRQITIENAHWTDGAVHFSVRGDDTTGATLSPYWRRTQPGPWLPAERMQGRLCTTLRSYGR